MTQYFVYLESRAEAIGWFSCDKLHQNIKHCSVYTLPSCSEIGPFWKLCCGIWPHCPSYLWSVFIRLENHSFRSAVE